MLYYVKSCLKMKMGFKTEFNGIFVRNESYWFLMPHRRHSSVCIDDWQWERNMYLLHKTLAPWTLTPLPRPPPPPSLSLSFVAANNNEKVQLYCRQWHPYTMHLRHVMGFALFHFHFSAKFVSVYLYIFFFLLFFSMCTPQIFPYTQASYPRTISKWIFPVQACIE